MVCDWGMSTELGPVSFAKKEDAIFLGRDFAQQSQISPDTAVKIDQEMKKIIVTNYDRARKLLEENRHLLEKIAEALLQYEVLDADQIRRVCEGLPIEAGAEPDDVGKKEPAKVKGRPVIVPQN
jgi:cell division protease FtsH